MATINVSNGLIHSTGCYHLSAASSGSHVLMHQDYVCIPTLRASSINLANDLVVTGNLTVQGETTTLNTTVTSTSAMCITNAGTGPALVVNQTGVQPVFDIQDDGSTVFYIEDGGNVGLGTNNPTNKIHVCGAGVFTSESNFGNDNRCGSILLSGADTGLFSTTCLGSHNVARNLICHNTASQVVIGHQTIYQNGMVLCAGQGSDTKFRFINSGSSERMRITHGGNVGIGTTNPSTKLHLYGGSLLIGCKSVDGYQTQINDNSLLFNRDNNPSYIDFTGTNNFLTFRSAGSVEEVRFTNSGAVFNSDGLDRDFRVEGDTDTHLIFTEGSSDRVGIGTASPSYKLDVNGQVRICCDLYFRGAASQIHSDNEIAVLTCSSGAQYVRTAGLQVSTSYTGTIPANGILFRTDTCLLRNSCGELYQCGGASNKYHIFSSDAGCAMLIVGKSTDGAQGTGAVEVTQDGAYGGGMSYNGDNSPGFAAGETADHTTFYRLSGGVRTEVFHYPYHSSVVNFNETPTVSGNPIVHDGNANYLRDDQDDVTTGQLRSSKPDSASIVSTGAVGNLANAALLAGSTSFGIGIDSNEIVMRGGTAFINQNSGHAMQFWVGDPSVTATCNKMLMHLDPDDYFVGIGTDNPDSKLHVSGGIAKFDCSITVTGTSDVAATFRATDDSWKYIQWCDSTERKFYTGLHSSGDKFILASDNCDPYWFQNTCVGIGSSSPIYHLDVTGCIRATVHQYIGNALIHDGDSDTYFQFNAADSARVVTGGAERIRFENSAVVVNDFGNSTDFRVEGDTCTHLLFVDGSAEKVGINQSVPTRTLDVVGTFTARCIESRVIQTFCTSSTAAAWYPIAHWGTASNCRGLIKLNLSYTGGSWTPEHYEIVASNIWNNTEGFIQKAAKAGNGGLQIQCVRLKVNSTTNVVYLEVYVPSNACGQNFQVRAELPAYHDDTIALEAPTLVASTNTGTTLDEKAIINQGTHFENVAASCHIYFGDKLRALNDSDTYFDYCDTNSLRVVTGGIERQAWRANESIINEGGHSYDFRVEGDTCTHLLFADASEDLVKVGADIVLGASGDTQARLVVNGGITTGSGCRLALDENFYVHANMRFGGSGGEHGFDLHGYYGFSFITRTSTEVMTILGNNGFVGIATSSPESKLHVKSGDSGATFSNINGLIVENSGNNPAFYAMRIATVGDNELFTATNAGNVGIGSASPSTKLDVSGETKSTNYRLSGPADGGAVPAYSNANYCTVKYNQAERATELVSSTDGDIGMAFPAFRVNGNSNEEYKIFVHYRTEAAASSGFYLRVYEYDGSLPSGKIAVSNSALNPVVQEDTRLKTTSPTTENLSTSTNWTTREVTYTPTSTAQWASVVILSWTGITVNNSLFVRTGITQTKFDADTLDGYDQTCFVRLAASSSSPTNGNFAIGNNSGRNFIQSHSSQPLDLNPLGNTVTIGGRSFCNTGSNAAKNADTLNSNGITYYTAGVTNFSGNATDGALYSQYYSSSWQHQIAGDYRSGQIAVRGKNNGTWQSWRKVWDESNDGSGSGLDADCLDGQHGSYYSCANNLTGTYPDLFHCTTRYNIGAIDGNGVNTRDKLRVWCSNLYTIGMQSCVTFGALNDFAMTFQMSSDDDRGFWWGDSGHSTAQGAMSLTTKGELTVAERLRIGGGQSDTTTPAYGLDVGRINSPTSTALFRGSSNHSHFNYSTVEDTYIRGGKAGSKVYINDAAGTGNIVLGTGGGRVGIGITAATAALHVYCNINTDHLVRIQNINTGSSARSGISLCAPDASGNLMIHGANYTGQTSWADRMVLGTDTNVSNGLLIRTASGGVQISGCSTSVNSPDFYVSSSGLVGIGTTNPDANHNLTIANDANYGIRFTNTNSTIEANSNLILKSANNVYLRPGALYCTFIDTGRGLQINAPWSADAYSEQFTIQGTFPSLALRSTNAGNTNLIHSDCSGDLNFYNTLTTCGYTSQGWGKRVCITTGGRLWAQTYIQVDTSGCLRSATGTFGSIEVDGGACSGYEGYSIGGRAVFMHNNSTITGLYDDVNNKWLFYGTHGAETRMFYNGTTRIQTRSDGGCVIGTLCTTAVSIEDKLVHTGDTDTYFQFCAADATRIVTGGTERMSVTNSAITFNEYGHSVDFRVESDNNEAMLMVDGSADKVGIGTITPSAVLDVSGTDTVFSVQGTNGTLFSVQDDLSDSLMSVNDAAGLPVLEVFADNSICAGRYTCSDFYIASGGNVGIGNASPSYKLDVTGCMKVGTSMYLGNALIHDGDTNTYFQFCGADAARIVTAGVERQAWRSADTVINEGGHNYDFRVEAQSTSSGPLSNKAYALFVDASAAAVGIGTSQPSYALEVGGTAHVAGVFTATTKNFLIDHPTKKNHMLRYGSLEGPENGVYVRGTTTINTIELPDYWTGLVDEDTITVNLTPRGKYLQLFIEKVEDNKVYVGGTEIGELYDYTVYGTRKDVDELVVEFERPTGK